MDDAIKAAWWPDIPQEDVSSVRCDTVFPVFTLLPQAAKIKGIWERKPRPFRLLTPVAEGFVHLV
jgi:hypothetical protein